MSWTRYFRKKNRLRNGKTKHHNLAVARGGKSNRQNVIILKAETHQLLHKIFGNRTIREIISVLERLDQAKKHQVR